MSTDYNVAASTNLALDFNFVPLMIDPILPSSDSELSFYVPHDFVLKSSCFRVYSVRVILPLLALVTLFELDFFFISYLEFFFFYLNIFIFYSCRFCLSEIMSSIVAPFRSSPYFVVAVYYYLTFRSGLSTIKMGLGGSLAISSCCSSFFVPSVCVGV